MNQTGPFPRLLPLMRPQGQPAFQTVLLLGIWFGCSFLQAQNATDARERPGPNQTEHIGPDETIHIHVGRSPSPLPSSDSPIPTTTPSIVPSPTPAPANANLPAGPDGIPGLATVKQFQSDVIVELQNKSIAAHTEVNGGLVRFDLTAMGTNAIVIVNEPDKKFSMIVPSQKMLMKIPWSDDLSGLFNPDKLAKGTWTKNVQGETVNDITCDTWTVMEPSSQSVVVDLDGKTGVPVKIYATDGSFVVFWKNFKPGAVPAERFALPTDYQEMELPAGFKLPELPPRLY